MNKFWLVCSYEYLRHVRRKRFIFALLSFPALVLLMVGAGFLAVWAEFDGRPLGYVDLAGVLNNPKPVSVVEGDAFPDPLISRYETEVIARRALDAKEIQGYFVIQPNYMNNGAVKFFTSGQAKDSSESAFNRFLRLNLIPASSPEVSKRLVEGPNIEIQSLGGSRKMGENDIFGLLMPLVTGILFLVVINTSGSYLVGALVEEKENRTMEIVVTSVSPNQLMAGKVIGNLAVGVTELLVWIGFGVVALLFARANLPPAQSLNLDIGNLWLSLFILIPAFVMVAGLMATAGSTSTDTREAQQIAGLFTLPVVVPFWLIVPLMESPNSPLSIGLSLFPLTAPISLPIRAAFTEVPAWQIGLSLGLLTVGAVGALWLAGRAFRLGMLRYGKRLAWREILGKA